MLFRSFCRSPRSTLSGSRMAKSGHRTLRMEMLEDRRLLSVTPYVVDSLADNMDLDGVVTLREAIEAANTGAIVGDAHAGSDIETDVITFDSSLHGGTIMLGGEELTVTDALEIQGPGAELLTIDANKTSRVLLAEQAGELEILGLTIQNGKAPSLESGGGILASSTTVSLNDVVIAECEAAIGGGIYSDSPLTITNSTLSGNAANEDDGSFAKFGNGGGVYGTSTLNVIGCMISDNEALYHGGGIYGTGTLSVRDAAFSANVSSYFGGAISTTTSSEFAITGSVFRQNASKYGGAINNAGTGAILSSTFEGNSSDYNEGWGRGGAINNGGDLEVTNSTIVGNRSPSSGGGITNLGTITLTNCTVAANEAQDGGGIWNSDTLNLRNSILFRNAGGEIHGDEYSEDEVFGNENNLIGVDPGFVRDPYEGDDGVWGTEDDDYGDLRLTDQSLAIDLGNMDLLPVDTADVDGDGNVEEPIPFDLAGDTRVYGDSVDAGAYELQGAAAPGRETPSVVVTIDAADVDPYDGEISLREAIHYSGLDGLGTAVTFAPNLDGAVILLDGTPLSVNKTLTIDASANDSVTIDAQEECTALERFGQPDSEVTLIGLTITRGHAYQGGGIRNETGDLSIIDCTIERNTAAYGGGVYHEAGDISIANSRFYGNAAVPAFDSILNLGGALILRGSGASSLVNSVLCGNTAERGGGISNYDRGTVLNVADCTFIGNHATGSGGVFASRYLTLQNSILYQNGGENFYKPFSGSNNLIGIDPRFVRDASPGEDAIWGTDDDDYGDLRLTDRSPAIDFGDSSFLPVDVFDLDSDGDVDEPIPVDLGGEPREYGTSVDCGAYEFQAEAATGRETPSLVVTSSSDNVNLYDGEVSLREAIFYAATNDLGATISFDPGLNNETILLGGESLMIDRAITIDASPLNSLTVDGGGRSGVFYIYGDSEDRVELIGLDITGGLAGYAGGIFSKSTLALRDCRLVDNTSRSSSGAVWNTGTMEMVDCELLYNRTAVGNENILHSGGAIRNSGVLTIANSVLAGNVADEGGAIYNQGTLTLVNSTVVGNCASHNFGRSGAIDAASGTYTLINTVITANSAYQGAGINDDQFMVARRDAV